MAPHNCICCGCQRQRNENLIVRIRPAAIALNYSIKRHAERRRTPDIRIRKIALMWSSLTLAAIINCFRMRPAWKSPWMRQPPASCVNIVSCSWMWILSIVWACMNIVSKVLQECCQFSLDASLSVASCMNIAIANCLWLSPAWLSSTVSGCVGVGVPHSEYAASWILPIVLGGVA